MNHEQLAKAISILRPGAQWTLAGDSYEGLEWNDQVQVKPTLQELEAVDLSNAAETVRANTKARADAITALLSDPSHNAKFIRAVLLTILDEINTIRALLVPAQAARTPTQMRNAIQNKINSGASD